MKKITLGLSLLLSGLAVNIQAAYPTGNSPCAVTVPSYCGGFTFGVTGLYWRPSPQEDFAVSFLSDESANLASLQNIESIASTQDHHFHNSDFNYDWGFKANIGYIFPCSGNDINLTYTHFNNTDDKTVDDLILPPVEPLLEFLSGASSGITLPTNFSNGGPISGPATLVLPLEAIISDPNFHRTDFSHQFFAKSEFKNNTWDLDFGQSINVGCNFNFRLFGGLRYSKVEHNFDSVNHINVSGEVSGQGSIVFTDVSLIVVSDQANLFPNDTVIGTVTFIGTSGKELTIAPKLEISDVVHHKSRFEVLGPRVGLDMTYSFCGGFGVVSSLSSALLIGNNQNDFSQIEDTTSVIDIVGEIVRFAIKTEHPNFNGSQLNPLELPNSPSSMEFDRHSEETQVVPNIDAKLGFNYSYQFNNCSRSRLVVEAGYQVSHYFNAINSFGLLGADIEGSDASFDNNNTIDVSFEGPYVSVQVAL